MAKMENRKRRLSSFKVNYHLSHSGVDVTMLCMLKELLWLVKNSPGTWNSQSECLISAHHSNATLKFVYGISSTVQLQTKEWFLCQKFKGDWIEANVNDQRKKWQWYKDSVLVVAQLVLRLLPKPEIHNTNLVIGQFYFLSTTNLSV